MAEALEASGGWYADFHSDTEVTVVFAGHVFRYRPGDDTERARVAEYGDTVWNAATPLFCCYEHTLNARPVVSPIKRRRWSR